MTSGARMAIEGRALHSGETSRVILHARPGPITLRAGAVEAPLGRWHAVPAERSTWLAFEGGAPRVRLVEHLLAALGGMGAHEGLAIEVEGTELPLLDGASRAWCAALADLGLAHGVAARRITRAATLDVGQSRYDFRPGERATVSVRIAFDDARLAADAAWEGDAEDFVSRIAPARTFCFAREIDELARKGLAAFATPEAVIVIGERILAVGAPYTEDEPARHKLLDVIGDLYLHGGPPRGHVHAFRPGHTATHEALRIAREEGILA